MNEVAKTLLKAAYASLRAVRSMNVANDEIKAKIAEFMADDGEITTDEMFSVLDEMDAAARRDT